MEPNKNVRSVKDTVVGTVAAISMMAGAAGGGMYLAPEQAGIGIVTLCIAAGAVGGWAAGYVLANSLGFLVGWKVMGFGYAICLVGLLAILGGMAGYCLSGGRIAFVVAGGLALGLPNLLLVVAWRQRLSRPRPDSDSMSETETNFHWPLLQRGLCFLSSLFVIGWGGYSVLTQTFLLQNRGSSTSAIEITGNAAVIIGLVIASFGAIFLFYCLFPQHRIWRWALRKRNARQDT